MQSYLFNTHNRSSIGFKKGRGVYLYAVDGKKYLDFAAGIAVNALGHCPRSVNKTLNKQAKKLWHISNLYTIPEAEQFAKMLCDNTFADKVFFCNSGAEALETVIKLARRYHYVAGNHEKNRIITFKGSFHGRTIATVCASGNTKYMEGFAPHLEGFDNIQYGNIELIKQAINPQTAAILIEPIQGEGGVNFAGFEFLRELRKLCSEHNILLALDEVQCGNGRTGKIFAHEHADITPDILATAKGIGNGFPLGAVLATNKVAEVIVPGTHGTTYGSNPLSMAVGMEVFGQITKPKFLANVAESGRYFMQKLQQVVKNHPQKLIEARGFGLMLGLQLSANYKPSNLLEKCRQNGLLAATAGADVLRLLPPLIITKKHIDEACKIIDKSLNSL